MRVGIIGLGLIGGSFAKALSPVHTVYGADKNAAVQNDALRTGAAHDELNRETLPLCDAVILGLYPKACVRFAAENAEYFKKGALLMDLCGVKRYVADSILPLAKARGFTYIGAHPMAGLAKVGWEYSSRDLFRGAPLILTPGEDTPPAALLKAEELAADAGFARVVTATPDGHDRVIAYTSQLAHILSNAYVKSPQARLYDGFSAGSFRDLTRVAWLNEDMWAELFLKNADYLKDEIDGLIERLSLYSRALGEGDRDMMRELLREGRIVKEGIGELR